MPSNLTWNVVKMDCYPDKDNYVDVVFMVHWTLTGEKVQDGQVYSANVYGSVGVQFEPGEVFTPYNQLTKDQVVGWVKNALGEEEVDAYEQSINNQIQAQINPPVVAPPLPWEVS
jgi:hypothetical protein